MAIEELVKVKAPPAQPIHAGPIERWTEIEGTLGLKLPKDLYDFCLRYGSGKFGDTIRILNPFSGSYTDSIKEICSCYRDLRRDEGEGFVPHPVYPESPGLFPWGDDVNGHMMFWLTEGHPDQWPTILLTIDGQSERINSTMTTFLAKSLSCEVSSVIWDDEWLRENAPHLDFIPARR